MNYLEKAKIYCEKSPKKIIFPDTDDPELLKACRELTDNKLIQPQLVGGPIDVREKAQNAGIHTRGITILHPMRHPDFYSWTKYYIKKRRHKGISDYEAEQIMRLALYNAVMRLAQGQADLCIAGNTSIIADVLRAGLHILGKIQKRKIIFGWNLMLAPDGENIMIFADTAVNPNPNEEQLVEIALCAAEIYNKISGKDPKVALLSFSTKGSAEHDLVQKIRNATSTLRQISPEVKFEGEIQFDAAFVEEIGKRKAPGYVLNGPANVFIFPSLNSANIGYKIARFIGGYNSIGPFFSGFNKPLHAFARGGIKDDIINSILIASYLTEILA
jgi:phosphotransacetylase